MALVWKGEYGVADDAWHDATSNYKPSSQTAVSSVIDIGVDCKEEEEEEEEEEDGVSRVVEGFVERHHTERSPLVELPPALILEVLKYLDARALCIISCACTLFRRLASDSHGWKDFYCERWGLPAGLSPATASSSTGMLSAPPGKSWRELYVAREERCKVLMGRFRMDTLHGHTAAVRCVRLLPAANMVFTAGYDQTVRLWNLEEGLPLACSHPLGETVRAIAVDIGLLAVAGTDAVVRVWRAIPECAHLFDVAGTWSAVNEDGAEMPLYGHTGPVTCLGLDATHMYSGSWDMSIRVWERSSFECVHKLMHMDWVWALVPRGRRILSTAGSDVYAWDVETGQQVRLRTRVHTGQAYAVEGSRSGHFVFTGGEDGAVRMFDDRLARRHHSNSKIAVEAIAAWVPHKGGVYSLAFEDPWLISASGDGTLAMMDVRQIMKRSNGNGKSAANSVPLRWCHHTSAQVAGKEGEEIVQRFLPGGSHQSAYCVDLGADRVVSGGEERIVRIWDFSQALEIESRVQASRSNRRHRRKQIAMPLTEQQKWERKSGPRLGVSGTSSKGIDDKELPDWVARSRSRRGQGVGAS
ncbi:unnamed protein product [Sphagnum tenellum]